MLIEKSFDSPTRVKQFTRSSPLGRIRESVTDIFLLKNSATLPPQPQFYGLKILILKTGAGSVFRFWFIGHESLSILFRLLTKYKVFATPPHCRFATCSGFRFPEHNVGIGDYIARYFSISFRLRSFDNEKSFDSPNTLPENKKYPARGRAFFIFVEMGGIEPPCRK